MTTTTDVFEALQNLVPEAKANPKAAKVITDYLEESKQLNIDHMKDVFLTKEDKVDLIGRIHRAEVRTIIWIVGTNVGVGLIQVLLKHFNWI